VVDKEQRNRIFAENLAELCAERRSVAEVCRSLGFNRQQFARYLNAETYPSSHNLKRIAAGFGVEASELTSPDFARSRRLEGPRLPGLSVADLFLRAFPGDLRRLKPLLGYHFMHFIDPNEPDRVVRSLIHAQEVRGMVVTKTIERVQDEEGQSRHFAKYDGFMSLHGTLLFLVEVERTQGEIIVESIFLAPPGKAKPSILTGMTLGVTRVNYSWPFASPIALKPLGETVDLKARIRECGSLRLDDRRLEPQLRSLFQKYRGHVQSLSFLST
jgi:transcriptional regulator with XRE-family HTH domain